MKNQWMGLRWIVAVVLCLSSWLVYAQKTQILHVSRVTPVFDVILPANPTTGYQWTVNHFDALRFKLTSKHFVSPQSKLIGAGGQMVFSFQLQKGKSYPKQTELSFRYAQPWNPPSATTTKVTVIFD